MKTILMAMIAAAGAFLLSAEMPRSEWHAKVGDCAQDPNMLKETISQLSSADKTAFLAEVNAAIDKMPGSPESKAAKFLAANRAAVAGAGATDRADVLAEVYATVPPEALPVINEAFAKNEFARPDTMTIDEFTNIVAQAMAKITQRTSTAESGSVRAAFAGVMLINASGLLAEGNAPAELATAIDSVKQAVDGASSGTAAGGTAGGAAAGGTAGGAAAGGTAGGAAAGGTAGGAAAGGAAAGGAAAGGTAGGAAAGGTAGGGSSPLASVIAAVVSSLPSDVRSDAIGSWIPSALGVNGSSSYDPMLAAAQAGDEPNAQVVLDIAPLQKVDSMLADLQSGQDTVGEQRPGTGGSSSASDPQSNGLSGVPRDRIQNPESPYYNGKDRGSSGTSGSSEEEPYIPTPEPTPYRNQRL